MRGSNSKSLQGRIYAQIREDLISGKYTGGTFLVEQDLCTQFGVSRTPVREALIRLSQDGYIEMIPNRGAFVPQITMKDIQELYDLRRVNDGLAAYLCCELATPALVEQMTASTQREEALLSAEDYAGASIEDLSFHSLYIKNCGSRALIQVIDLLEHQMARTSRLGADREANLEASLGFHRQLIGAFEKHDAPLAREVMEAHWESNKQKYIRRYLEGTISLQL